jgi:hypothetical protein
MYAVPFLAHKVTSTRELGEIMKAEVQRNEEREERISMEIVVDAYDQEEQAMGCPSSTVSGNSLILKRKNMPLLSVE